MGDSADNIPGAPGLGEKTASVLMGEYKTLDNIINNLQTIPERVGKKYNRFIKIIEENKKIIYLSKKLATLDYIDDVKKDFKDLERSMIDIKKIDSFFKETGMRENQRNSWIKDIQKLVVT
jgi:DNA polymerase-1